MTIIAQYLSLDQDVGVLRTPRLVLASHLSEFEDLLPLEGWL